MNFDQIKPFIVKTIEEGYTLELWNKMLTTWGIKNNKNEESEFEQFLSKLMEFHRACVEEGDKMPTIFMKKDFRECRIELVKLNGKRITYVLHPFGYNGQWEIFRVVTS